MRFDRLNERPGEVVGYVGIVPGIIGIHQTTDQVDFDGVDVLLTIVQLISKPYCSGLVDVWGENRLPIRS